MTPHTILVSLLAVVVAGCLAIWGMDEHDARVRAQARFADSARVAAIRTAILEQKVSDAESALHASAETVTVRRTDYRRVRDTLYLNPATHADTVHDIAMLPTFVRAADDALAADSAHQATAATFQHAADSLIVALRTERDLWKGAKQFTPPRVTSTLTALYEPLTGVPSGSAQLTVRAFGPFSVVARADQRVAIGEKPRLGAGLSLTF